jgi:hypothetical protein
MRRLQRLETGKQLSRESLSQKKIKFGRYLEGLQPELNLLWRDLSEQAEIERWNRWMELKLFAPI